MVNVSRAAASCSSCNQDISITLFSWDKRDMAYRCGFCCSKAPYKEAMRGKIERNNVPSKKQRASSLNNMCVVP